MANLPADLVDDIILRLPVESLLRFRCVSKPWLSHIDSPEFIKLHLNHAMETRSNRILVLKEFIGRGTANYSLTDSHTTYMFNVDTAGVPLEIDHPLKNSYKERPPHNWFKGSCNGLILICCNRWPKHDINIIWNPSTRNHHILPFAEFDPYAGVGNDDDDYDYAVKTLFYDYAVKTLFYGLGYDSVHDDYKVVRILSICFKHNENTEVTEVKVHSFKSNTWRRIQEFPHYFYGCQGYRTEGVLCRGALHWLVCEDSWDGDNPFITALDVATEEYHFLPMPPNIERFCKFGERVEVLEECLCICNLQSESIDVWVMKCYGVRESWTKLISVDILPDRPVNRFCQFIIPLAMSKDSIEVLFMHSDHVLIWVDLHHGVSKRIDVPGLFDNFHAKFVTQSLVPLGSGNEPNV